MERLDSFDDERDPDFFKSMGKSDFVEDFPMVV